MNECIIIGNGPSLNDVPVGFFSQYPTWGVNKIFLPRTDGYLIKPSYYVTCHENMAPFANEINALGARMFIKDKIADLFPGAMPIRFTDKKKDFSITPHDGIWEGWSVIYIVLQLAYWQGFRTALLVGLDHDYANGSYNPNYMDGVDTKGDTVIHDQDKLLPAFRMAKQAWEADGRRIINLTPNTKEPIFEKGKLEEWLNR